MKITKAQKKLFMTATAATVAAATLFTIVGVEWSSAGSPPTVMITDGGSKNDKSFNQQSYEAMKAYSNIVDQRDGYIKPSSNDVTEKKSIYWTLLVSGAESLVLPGFTHEGAIWETWYQYIKPTSTDIDNSNQKQFLFIDDGSSNFANLYAPQTVESWGLASYAAMSSSDFSANLETNTETITLGINEELTHQELLNIDINANPSEIYEETATQETTCYQYTDNTNGSIHNWVYTDDPTDSEAGWSSNNNKNNDSINKKIEDKDGGTNVTCNIYSSNDNVSSVKYYSEQAGFAVGIISSLYVVTEFSDPADWTLGAWVGGAYSTTMDFLSGYAEGVNFFNEYMIGNADANPYYSGKSTTGNYVKIVSPLGDDSVNVDGTYNPGTIVPNPDSGYGNGWSADRIWASGGFEPEKGITEASSLYSKGAKVMFPIAGPQTKHALNKSAQYPSENIMVVGVDVDNTLSYPSQADMVLTSATKTINSPVENPDNDKTDRELANEGGPTTRLLYDWQEQGVMEDYVGTISNGGVGFIESEKSVEDYNAFKDSSLMNIDSGLEAHLTSVNANWKTDSTFTLTDFILEASIYANNPDNNVQLAHGKGQETGIQSLEGGIFKLF